MPCRLNGSTTVVGRDRRAAGAGRKRSVTLAGLPPGLAEQDLFFEGETGDAVGRPFGEVPPPEIGLRAGRGRSEAGKRGAQARRRDISGVEHGWSSLEARAR